MIFKKFQKNLRYLLSKQYLDFAEPLPSFNNSLIAKLQEIRKLQRENAQHFFNEINSFQDREISLSRIYLVDVFNTGLFHSKFRHFVHLRECTVPGIRDFRLRWLKPPKLVA